MKVAMLGTGVRSPGVLLGLAKLERELGITEVALHDNDTERLDIISTLGAYLCREAGASFTIRAERDPRVAIAGSRFIYTAIRVGQERARVIDEQLPLKYGVLGQETTGPGGFAMAMRTIPVMLDYARMIEDVAPSALVVNFTNPVGLVMQALCDHTAIHVVGVCDGPPHMHRSVAAFLGVAAEDVHVDYFGLNHCGWIRRVLVEGEDRLPEILRNFEELQRSDDVWAVFDPELVRSLGALPMEYLYFYYYREQAVEHIRRSGSTRGEQIATLNASLWPALRQSVEGGDLAGARDAWLAALRKRDATYFARERGHRAPDGSQLELDESPSEEGGYAAVAAAVMASVELRRKTSLILNVPNHGAIPDLRDEDVVEVSCLVDGDGAHPLAQGALPDAMRGLIESLKTYERLTVEAAVEGSYEKALRALVVHPLVGSYPLAKAVLDGYVSAHEGFLSHVEAM
jgi:6-phospho-beta-glucosidase